MTTSHCPYSADWERFKVVESENMNHGSLFADFPPAGQRGIVTLVLRREV